MALLTRCRARVRGILQRVLPRNNSVSPSFAGCERRCERLEFHDRRLQVHACRDRQKMTGNTCQLVLGICPCVPAECVAGSNVESHENTIDSVDLLLHSALMSTLFVVLAFSCLDYNLSGIAVTKALTAACRVIIEALRTLVVWSFRLGEHNVWRPSLFRARLTWYSTHEAAGSAHLCWAYRVPVVRGFTHRESDLWRA